MKDSRNKKLEILHQEDLTGIVNRKVEDVALMQSLLAPELFTHDFADEQIEREKLIIKLRGEREFTIEEYISEHLVEYKSRFTKEFYYGIAKLHGIDKTLMDKYVKPQCAIDFTLKFIYGRFPNKVLNSLRSKSPWTEIPGVRQNKLFQYLTTFASEDLDKFIAQAIAMMSICDNITDFKLQYSREYKIYFQIDMFTDVAVSALY